jgi:transposase
MLWWDCDGLCLFAKRLEKGRFVWPKVDNGTVALTRAQLPMLLEGIDWRRPIRTHTPELSVYQVFVGQLCRITLECGPELTRDSGMVSL